MLRFALAAEGSGMYAAMIYASLPVTFFSAVLFDHAIYNSFIGLNFGICHSFYSFFFHVHPSVSELG